SGGASFEEAHEHAGALPRERSRCEADDEVREQTAADHPRRIEARYPFEMDLLRAGDLHRFPYGDHGELARVAIRGEPAEIETGHRSERGERAVHRELAPARSLEIGRALHRERPLEQGRHRRDARLACRVRGAEGELATARDLVLAPAAGARRPPDDRAEHAALAHGAGRALFGKAVLHAHDGALGSEERCGGQERGFDVVGARAEKEDVVLRSLEALRDARRHDRLLAVDPQALLADRPRRASGGEDDLLAFLARGDEARGEDAAYCPEADDPDAHGLPGSVYGARIGAVKWPE